MSTDSNNVDKRIRHLIARVDSLGSGGDHSVDWSGAVTEGAINRMEVVLGVRLPSSYKAFARLVGGEGLDAFPISSIASRSDDVSYGTVYGHTMLYRESWVPKSLPQHLVVVQRDADDNEPFCLDTSTWRGDECPVVLYYLHSGKTDHIAVDFVTFYEQYLQPYLNIV